ncbi:MAG: GNAT family N-acetyltransferase [Lachnospiraceae bacterium]|nr:GNAT family N-acetyltransferase [Lachnospiraceae bacterium]
MEIRKCRKEDVKETGEFYDMTVRWLDCHINYPKWIYKIYPSEDSAGRMAEAGEQYICIDDGRITGAFVLNTDPQGDYEKGSWRRDVPRGSYLVIHAMAVDPALHGQGIGSEILQYCRQTADAGGYKALRADAVPDNLPVKRMLEKNGFTHAGDADLGRGLAEIPVFSLYELNL